jgi:hypothetical protein
VAEVAGMVISWALTTAALFAIVLFDERRMRPEHLERAWPPSSRNAALVVFGVLAIPIHFIRTRRSLAGVALGIGAFALCIAFSLLVDVALDLVLR